MTVPTLAPVADLELRRIAALLDRMDPTPSVCTVPGCTHLHDTHEVADAPLAA